MWMMSKGIWRALLAAQCAAHEEGADDEDDEEVPAGKAAGGDPERRQRGPEQQQPARGPVPADQVESQGETRASKGQVPWRRLRSPPSAHGLKSDTQPAP
jgi:hypothetical protein